MDYVLFGAGERTLVLLPGLGLRGVAENGRAMAHMYRRLAQAYRVCILDCRRQAPQPCTVRALAADAAWALDALGIRRADVLGVSMGGMIAQYLALERPDLVEKLALAVTLSRPNDTIRAVSQRWVELAEQNDYEALAQDVMARSYSDDYLRRFGRLLSASVLAARPAALERFAALARACLTCDTYDRLGQIRCPALVIGAEQDRVVTGRAAEEMAARLGCELYMYRDLGHAAYEQAPDFCERVLRFFEP